MELLIGIVIGIAISFLAMMLSTMAMQAPECRCTYKRDRSRYVLQFSL